MNIAAEQLAYDVAFYICLAAELNLAVGILLWWHNVTREYRLP